MTSPQLGTIIEISHDKWVEKYIVTSRWDNGYQITKTKLSTTKIGNLRFPPIITIHHKANSIPDNKS